MGENYIHIDNIRSRDMGDGCRETFAVYQLCITGMERVAVVSILSRLLHHIEIDPLEIITYRLSHDDSRDHSHGIAVWPEALRRAAELLLPLSKGNLSVLLL